MSLVFVGSTSGAGTSTGYTVSLSGTLTGGIASSPSSGDIVLVVSAFGNTASSAPNVSGNNSGAYTGFQTAVHVNDTYDTEFRTFYAVMGASVDTTLTITRTTSTAYGGATVVMVYRGQHTTSPIIQNSAYTTTTNGAYAVPTNASLTAADQLVVSFGAGTQPSTGSAFTVPAALTGNKLSVKADGSTSDIGVWAADVFPGASGSYTINAFSGGSSNTSCSGAAHTIVLAPEPPAAVNGTATLTGVSATAGIGSLSAKGDASKTLAGVSASSGVGALAGGGNAATSLSGVSASSAVGTVVGEAFIPVDATAYLTSANSNPTFWDVDFVWDASTWDGSTTVAQIGTLSAKGDGVAVLTGVSATVGVGSLAGKGDANKTLTGASVTSGVGVLVGGVSVSATLVGVLASSGIGSLSAKGDANKTLTGASSSSGIGALTGNAQGAVSLVGVSAGSGIGTLTATGQATAALVGRSASTGAGVLSGRGDGVASLSGRSASSGVGSLSLSGTASADLVGAAAVAAAGVIVADGGGGPPPVANEDVFAMRRRRRL